MDTEDMLADLGCTAVVTAATIADGLARVAGGIFDAALLDLNLDGDRSYAVADALIARGVPFAFATGYGLHGLRDSDSGRPVLMKPYPAEELAKTMIALLHHA
jgi:CheY-like chemotaxis protein